MCFSNSSMLLAFMIHKSNPHVACVIWLWWWWWWRQWRRRRHRRRWWLHMHFSCFIESGGNVFAISSNVNYIQLRSKFNSSITFIYIEKDLFCMNVFWSSIKFTLFGLSLSLCMCRWLFSCGGTFPPSIIFYYCCCSCRRCCYSIRVHRFSAPLKMTHTM